MKCGRCGCYIPENATKCVSCGADVDVVDGCYVTFRYHGEEIKAYVEKYETMYTGTVFLAGRMENGRMVEEKVLRKRKFTLIEV